MELSLFERARQDHTLARISSLLKDDTVLKDVPEEIKSFPSIIISGQEGSGKTALLERLLMTRLLPSDGDISTSPIPIEVVFKRQSRDHPQANGSKDNKPAGDNKASSDLVFTISYDKINSPIRKSFPLPLKGDNRKEVFTCIGNVLTAVSHEKKQNPDILKEFLRLELSSSDSVNLRIIYLPGFHAVKKKGETDESVQIMNRLIDRHLNEPSVHLLTVSSINDSIANDAIIRKAQDCNRITDSIGVLTKSDLCNNSGNEAGRRPIAKIKHKAEENIEGLSFVAVKQFDRHASGGPDFISAAQDEKKWFKENAPSLLNSDEATFDILIKLLISKVLSKYKEENKDELLDIINSNMEEVTRSLAKLGPIDDVEDALVQWHGQIVNQIKEESIEIPELSNVQFENGNLFNNEPKLEEIRERLQLSSAKQEIMDRYQSIVEQNDLQNNLKRFEGFTQHVTNALHNFLEGQLEKIEDEYNNDFKTLKAELRWNNGSKNLQPAQFSRMKDKIKNLYSYYASRLRLSLEGFTIDEVEYADMNENETSRQERERLEARREGIIELQQLLSLDQPS